MQNFQIEFNWLVSIAAGFHYQGTRKGRKGIKGVSLRMPYIIHQLKVLERIYNWGIDEDTEDNRDVWKATLFHDTKEDTLHHELEPLIGKNADNLVNELTFVGVSEDKNIYLQSFSTNKIESLVIKIADRLCNVEDFYVTDRVYAFKYYHKADVLFDIFKQRYEEVKTRFGDSVAESIRRDIEYIGSRT